MIEELKNTAVKVDNEQQARCVVLLCEQHGLKPHTGLKELLHDFENLSYDCVYVSGEGTLSLWVYSRTISRGAKTINLDQLAWDYGLAPEWATQLDIHNGVFYYSNKEKAYHILDKREIKLSDPCDDADEIVSIRPQVKQAMFKSGQHVYIAQINTLAGVSSKRYFVEQSWCNSGHQQEYVALGIIFDNKHDAENKCRELLGIPLIKTERDEFIEKARNAAGECYGYDLDDYFHKLYDAGARFND